MLNKSNFTFLPQQMQSIENKMNLLKGTSAYNEFITIFKDYFPNSRIDRFVGGQKNNSNDKLTFYITVDLELHPGSTITPDEMKTLKCDTKWYAVEKAWSEFIGSKTVKRKDSLEPNNKTRRR
jgi:hypothetical protein